MSVARGLHLGHPLGFFSRRLSRKEGRAFIVGVAGVEPAITPTPRAHVNRYTTPRKLLSFGKCFNTFGAS